MKVLPASAFAPAPIVFVSLILLGLLGPSASAGLAAALEGHDMQPPHAYGGSGGDLLLASTGLPEINPQGIESATIRITKNGTLTPSGIIQSATLTLRIAQEGLGSISVTPDDWEYVNDSMGNRMVKIRFRGFNGPQGYSLVQAVNTRAQRLDFEARLATASAYTPETSGAQLTAAIGDAAHPFERSMKGVSDIAAWVHSHVEYDMSVFGQNKPSDWVFANRRGVCVEFSNLMVAMLRSKGIPARYVSGYAYSTKDRKLIGHAWLEVLADSGWVGFDPTWLEGGFIDATHVRTSVSLDGVEKETLDYVGRGDLEWDKSDSAELLDYSEGSGVSVSVEMPERVPLEGGGYIKAVASFSGCRISVLNVSSCINSNDEAMLNIGGGARSVWSCASASAFWPFTNSLGEGFRYSCPVVAYDQSGGSAEAVLNISGEAQGPAPSISGPDSAGANAPFTISSSGRLFSAELGEGASPWTLSLAAPGTYDFYAYANGRLAHKAVEVRAGQEFELSVQAPASVNQSSSFTIVAAVRNIGSSAKTANVRAVFGNQSVERLLAIGPGLQESASFNLTAYENGSMKYRVSASADSFAGFSGAIEVLPAPERTHGTGGLLDALAAAIGGFFAWLTGLFGA